MQKIYGPFSSVCPVCGDFKEACENCDNCESEGLAPFNLERAIEQAESIAELFNLR